MDYLYERRRRRRKYRSPLSNHRSSSREDNDIEQEIIDRAMEIERTREKSLRRQFEYIVYNVKELERRRQQRYQTQSPDYSERTTSSSRHRSPHRHSYGNSSLERYSQTNEESSYSDRKVRSSSKSKKSIQITMIYRGNGNEKHGDEIMVLQENLIVFKGFLRPQETFTFKFKQRHRQLIVKLEFFINEIFECCLAIDCQRQNLQPDNEFFQLEYLQIPKTNQREETNDQQQVTSGNNKSDHLRKHHQTSSRINQERRATTTNENDQQQQKSKSPSNQTSKRSKRTSREMPYVKQRSHHSPTPPQSPPPKPSEKSKANSSQTQSVLSRQSSAKTISTTERKTQILPVINSDNNDDNDNTSKQNNSTKRTYGPPQVSTFARSSSESLADELSNIVKKQDDDKPSRELVEQTSSSSPTKKDNNQQEEEEGEGEDGESNDSSGVVGFLQLLQAMSGGALRLTSSNDDSDGIQGLLTRLGIVTQTNSRKKPMNFKTRQIGNVENFLLVYLDSTSIDEDLLIKFRGLVNSIKLFDDADDCIAFINSISNEKVLLIVNDALGDPVVSRIQDLQQLFAIYVLCQTDEQTENWSTNQPKIRGISTDINQILIKIKTDIENDEEDFLTWTYSLPNSNAKDEPLFVINQILKQILLDPDEMNDALKELVDFSREEYENNDQQLTNIQLFEQNYQKQNVFKYFQKDQFLYKMLNKGFRIPEVDILFKLRLFIQDLHQLIISSSKNSFTKTVYRSQFVTNDELETLKKFTDGTLIGFSHFFIGSSVRPEQKSKTIEPDQENNNNNTGEEILFQIDISNSNQYMLMDNNQILVTFGLVTKFRNIEKDKNGQTIINLLTITNDDRQLEHLIEPIRKETRAPYPSLRIVKLFIELEQYSHAIHLGQVLLGDLSSARKDPILALARTYHSLGTTLYEKDEYDQALDVIKKSHELYLRFLPEDAPQLSPTWNNMGSIYLRQGKTDLALEYHEKALSIQLKSPSPDLPSIISYSNNIGGVYLKLERYDEALIHFKRALQIEEQTLPTNHPELAGTYHRIGGVYFRQNNFEKALEYYDKTLQIEVASLPENHPTVAVTYHNRATAFEGLGKLDEAVQSAEKAVERLLKTLPKEHPQVRMNQVYADRLKQKLWVKQLFT